MKLWMITLDEQVLDEYVSTSEVSSIDVVFWGFLLDVAEEDLVAGVEAANWAVMNC